MAVHPGSAQRSLVKPVDIKPEVVVLGVSDRPPEGVLPKSRLAARHRRREWRRFPRRADDAAQLESFDHLGKGVTSAKPGSAELVLAVDDVGAARDDWIARDVKVSEVFHARAGSHEAA